MGDIIKEEKCAVPVHNTTQVKHVYLVIFLSMSSEQ